MGSDDLIYCEEKNGFLTTAPIDFGLLAQAKAAIGHISEKAVMDEYNRLLLAYVIVNERPASGHAVLENPAFNCEQAMAGFR